MIKHFEMNDSKISLIYVTIVSGKALLLISMPDLCLPNRNFCNVIIDFQFTVYEYSMVNILD
jgi:hypothetical protein